jgi:phage shock protein PspC (stress-responsive transcriptional regulator)
MTNPPVDDAANESRAARPDEPQDSHSAAENSTAEIHTGDTAVAPEAAAASDASGADETAGTADAAEAAETTTATETSTGAGTETTAAVEATAGASGAPVAAHDGETVAETPWGIEPQDDLAPAAETPAEASAANGTADETPGDASTPQDGAAASNENTPGSNAPGDGTPGGPQPGPQAGGYAAQFGLVRPVEGRYIAGVCAALGRATNTDPVLWRVVLPVLTVVGGLGGLLYLLGWVLIPAEGDSASPFEALIGRGHSSTSKAWTIVLSVVALSFLIGGFTSGPGSRFLLFAAVIGGAVLLITSRDPRSGWRRPDPSRPAFTPPTWTPATPPTWSPATPPSAAPWSATTVAGTTGTEMPAAETAYQAPFAPHGPFQPAGTFATSVITPTELTPPDLPPSVPPAPAAPKPVRARRAILSAAVLAVGLLGALQATGLADPTVAAYFAVALGVIGVGMIVASLFGRVRGPVTLGILLAIGLLVSSIAGNVHARFYGDETIYRPTSIADLNTDFDNNIGKTTLDLRQLDFSKAPAESISVRVNVGAIRVLLPPNVDATITGQVDVGGADVLGHHLGGIGNNPFSFTDTGADGKGGGSISIDTNVNVGKVEVTR